MRVNALLSAAALTAVSSATYPLSLVYQFQNSFSSVGYVNIENIAVRPNGQLLLNTVTGAIMAGLDPANPVAQKLVNITGALGNGQPGSLTGIAEYSSDVYAVAAGNFQFGPQVPGGIKGVPGSFSVWSVDLNGGQAKPTLITTIPEASSLNGAAALPNNKDIVLIADSLNAVIYSVNVKTGAYKSVISSPLFQPSSTNNFGINGLKIQGCDLYFTNSAQNIYGTVQIDPHTGEAVGDVKTLAVGPAGTYPDDFSFKPGKWGGDAYVAGHPSIVYKVPKDGGDAVILANDTMLLGPTATAFGQDGCTCYITTGGQGGPAPVSGQVFALDTCGEKKMKRWIA